MSTQSRAARAARSAWIVLVLFAAVAPPVAVLASGRTLSWRDTAALIGPLRGLVVAALRDLRLPLWNPHEAFGIPLFAQLIHGVLHPVSVALALVAPRAGMDAAVVVYVAAAALGAALLARALGVSRGGAATAALAYAGSGYVLGMAGVLTYLAGAATAPWTVAAMRLAGARRTWGLVAAGGAVAAQHFAGDPQWTVVSVGLGLALAVEAGGPRGAARAAAGVALGTTIAAVQLVPAWAFLPETLRSGGLSAGDRAQWALSPWRLVELVAPGFFNGRPGEELIRPVYVWLGGPTQPGMLAPFVPSVFVGAATVVLALAGARATRAGRVLAVVALVFAWLALGVHAGAQQLLAGVPVWGGFRYSEKLAGPLTLALAVLAGLGVDRLGAGCSRRRSWGVAAVAAVAGVLAVVLATTPALEAIAASAPAGAAHAARVALSTGLAHAAVALAALAGLFAWAARSERGRRALGAGAALVVFVACAAASPYALHAGVRGLAYGPPLAALAAGDPLVRVATPLEAPPYRSPIPLDETDRELAVRARMATPPLGVPAHVENVSTYTGLLPRRIRAFGEAFGSDVWRALRRFGLTHVVLKEPGTADEALIAEDAVYRATPVAAAPEWGITVFSVPHRAWARFADRVSLAATDEEALRAVMAADLAGIPGVVLVGASRASAAPGRVLSMDRRDDRLRIEAEADGDGVLVVSDAWWPGWRATLDGAEVPVLRADYLVRGVEWPRGRHVLEMRYDPPEVRLGLWITALGLAALATAAVAGPGRARARRGKTPT